MKEKTPRTPTESIKFADIWNGFNAKYLPFVEWFSNPDTEETFIVVKFVDDNPEPYVNKWSREQFKIKVLQNGENRILSAGKKLFQRLKAFCIEENKLPSDLGEVQIDRYGSGFDTDYKIQYKH